MVPRRNCGMPFVRPALSIGKAGEADLCAIAGEKGLSRGTRQHIHLAKARSGATSGKFTAILRPNSSQCRLTRPSPQDLEPIHHSTSTSPYPRC
jgi:hypothetical protein